MALIEQKMSEATKEIYDLALDRERDDFTLRFAEWIRKNKYYPASTTHWRHIPDENAEPFDDSFRTSAEMLEMFKNEQK